MGYSGSFPYTNTKTTAGIQVKSTSFSGNVSNAGTITTSGISVTNSTISGSIVDSSTLAGGITVDSKSEIAANTTTPTAILVTGPSFSGGISNAGTLTATGAGISVQSSASKSTIVSTFSGGITNSGTISLTAPSLASFPTGIRVKGVGTFQGGISNTGSISSTVGIAVEGGSTFQGSIVNATGATITASRTAILASVADFIGSIINNGAITIDGNWGISDSIVSTFDGGITNAGTIAGNASGEPGVGIRVTSNRSSSNAAVTQTFTGSIVNTTSALISAQEVGVDVFDLEMFGSSSGGGITNSGAVTAQLTGIEVLSISTFAGNISNAGTIAGQGTRSLQVGLFVDGIGDFGGNIVNSGSIAAGNGIEAENIKTFAGSIDNSSGGTISAANAITADNIQTFIGNIDNAGTITAGNGIFVSTVQTFAGHIANSSGAAITGAVRGIDVTNVAQFGTNVPGGGIVNAGTISVNLFNGILVGTGVSAFFGGITNSGTIVATSGANAIIVGSTTSQSATLSTFVGGITNSGTISAGPGAGILAGGTAGNGASVKVSTFAGGVSNSGLIVANTAVIVGGITTTEPSGTYAGTVTTLTVSTFAGGITNSSTISAGANGIVVGGYGVANSRAAYVAESVTVSTFSGGISNSGTISAGGHGIVVGAPSMATVGVATFIGGIQNSGTITGGGDILVAGVDTFSGDIVNAATGSLVANAGAAIQVGDQGTKKLGSTQTYSFSQSVQSFLGSIINHGSITAAAATGILVENTGTFSGGITNTGTISGSIGIKLINEPGVSVFDSGTIIGTGGTAIQFDPAVALVNTLTLGPGYAITGNVVGDGFDVLQLGGTGSASFNLSNVGTQYTGFSSFNVIGGTWTATGSGSGWNVETGGTLRVSGTASATTISGGTVDVMSGGSLGSSLTFASASGSLQIDGPNAPGSNLLPGTTISGFVSGDTIDLTAIGYATGDHADMNDATDVLTITEGGTTYTLDFSGDFTGDSFHLAPDGGGSGTLITETPCYCPGTLIRTQDGERPVERLSIGDAVMTASGALRPIKWIGRRSYGGRFIAGRKDIQPVCIRAGALGDNVPARDLWISPHHAMYFENRSGGVLIEAKDLLNGISIVQAQRIETVEYVHIELDTHDVILAEGAPSETFMDDDNRGMFHNAHEYDTLYADDVPPPARYCAPRLDEGFAVEDVRRSIAQRAGLLRIADGQRLGALRGDIDLVSETCIAGWAQNVDAAEAPVCLDVYVGDRLVGQALANRYRADLARAGLGSGRHGFEFTVPAGTRLAHDAVKVWRSLDNAPLSLSTAGELTVQKRSCVAPRSSA